MNVCRPILTNTATAKRTEIAPIVEPVTLEEAKAYMRISSSQDDAEITQMITEARRWVENRCGISIVAQGVEALIEVMNEQELPYGPIEKASVMVINADGDTVADPNIVGIDGDYLWLRGYGEFTVTYDAGMESVPQELKQAIKAHVAFSYENRGDEIEESDTPYAKIARAKSNMFRRTIGF